MSKPTRSMELAAAAEAQRAAQPIAKALAEAREAIVQAKADVNHLESENVRVWYDAYDKAIGGRE